MSNLAYRQAAQHVKSFSDESEHLMTEHREAMECLDCEAFLQLGIDAFHWLMRADESIRRMVYKDPSTYDRAIDDGLKSMCRDWLRPCDFAERWIQKQVNRNFKLANLDEFRQCEREVQAIVKAFDGSQFNESLSRLRDSALTEHQNGETAEFF